MMNLLTRTFILSVLLLLLFLLLFYCNYDFGIIFYCFDLILVTFFEYYVISFVNNYYLLSIHFLIYFRKTCQACKCPRDTHAVYQEQMTSVQERLGFKSDMHTMKIDPKNVGYTWVPPGIMTSAKVKLLLFFNSSYMKYGVYGLYTLLKKTNFRRANFY